MAKAGAKEKEQAEEQEEKQDVKDARPTAEDADGLEEGDAAEGEAGSKKSKKKIIIIGVLALLALLGGGAAAYFTGMIGASEEEAVIAVGEDGQPLDKPVYYTMPEFLVNLNSGSKQTSFLKTTIILELANQGDVQKIEANLPRLHDSLNTYLRELRASDLSGSAGIQRLREEILLRANKSLAPVKVNDVLFKEIIVQ